LEVLPMETGAGFRFTLALARRAEPAKLESR